MNTGETMTINVLGINHKTTPIGIRKSAVKNLSLRHKDINKIKGVNEVVVLFNLQQDRNIHRK